MNPEFSLRIVVAPISLIAYLHIPVEAQSSSRSHRHWCEMASKKVVRALEDIVCCAACMEVFEEGGDVFVLIYKGRSICIGNNAIRNNLRRGVLKCISF